MIAEITGGNAAIVVAVLTLLIPHCVSIYQTFLKDRRERESDKQSLVVQRDISDNIRAVRDGQILQNGKLATVVEVNRAYHDELIRILPTTCKAQPQITQVNVTPEKK